MKLIFQTFVQNSVLKSAEDVEQQALIDFKVPLVSGTRSTTNHLRKKNCITMN